MKLFLMRHGEAEPYRLDDATRALTATGKASVASKACAFPDIDLLIVSPFLRALQTADILVEQGVNVKRRQVDDRVLPDCALEPIVNELINPHLNSQLIVAHNPLLSRLTNYLCDNARSGLVLDTASVVCLYADDFFAGSAELLWFK